LAGVHNLHTLPESVTGRQITYVSADTYFFYGTVQQNLLYGLKHIPLNVVEYKGAKAASRKWELLEAKRTANPVLDLNSNWIDDEQVTGLNANTSLVDAMRQVLQAVNFSDDVFDFALHSKISSHIDPDFAHQIVSLRNSIQEALNTKGLSELIIPFDVDSFNQQATVLENILFGILTDPENSTRHAGVNSYLHNMLRDTKLDAHLVAMGMSIAEAFDELFRDLPEDHPHFDQFDLIEPSRMPEYKELQLKCTAKNFENISAADRLTWINLSFKYSEPHYRFGLLDEKLMQEIVEIRKRLHAEMPEDLKLGIEIYDAGNFLSSANMLDNIVFGKLDKKIKNGEQKLRDVVAPLLDQQPELYNNIYCIGLGFNVGPSGRRLSPVQRQKLNLARGLMRRSDFYVFNRPVSGLDRLQQGSIIENTLSLLENENGSPGIVWVVASESNAKFFDKKIGFTGTKMNKNTELLDT